MDCTSRPSPVSHLEKEAYVKINMDLGVLPCTGRSDLFFSNRKTHQTVAKALCRTCVVKIECLQLALDSETGDRRTTFGVYGGMTPVERVRIKRRLLEGDV